MAQPVSNPKIEELRFRLKTDPKSRIFYPLAEELRKVSQFAEAEQVLHTGLANHPTYLSAWVSLGRIHRELGKNDEAVEALTKALQLDPGNVVAARILADAYLALGEKVEAIKKYKLVHALLPSDVELEVTIERLEKELHPPPPVPVESIAIPEAAPEQPPALDETPWADEQETGDAVPMAATHSESPFEEPAADFGYSSDAFSIEQPEAMHVEPMPVTAELPGDVIPEPEPELEPVLEPELEPVLEELEAEPADVFAPAEEPEPESELVPFPVTAELPSPSPDDFSKTITMADLYAKQGLIDEARDIYEDILARDPNNDGVRAKLEALDGDVAQTLLSVPEEPPQYEAAPIEEAPTGVSVPHAGVSVPHVKIARLEGWLARVGRRDIGGV